MWQTRFLLRPQGGGDLLALQSAAQGAGLALACPFSTSAEFEAAVLAARRRAGAFGAKRRRYLTAIGATVGVVVLSFCLI